MHRFPAARRAGLFVCLLALVCSSAALGALPAGVTAGPAVGGISEYNLANGLKILLLPDESQETITVNVTYLVGSRHEGYGERGMAHLLEHMLFKGSPRFANPKAELLKRGARYNGTTSYDRTNYFETFPASADTLDFVLDLEADRMVNARVAKTDLDSEMTVVRNEFESGENSPTRLLHERTMAAAYMWHNYGRAIIGTRSDIENVPIERLQAFYRHYYQPDNGVVIIAGKFEPEKTLASVARTFGRIPRPTRSLHTTYTVEPPQDGERTVILRRVGDIQMATAMYHIPAATHPDYVAADILTQVLIAQPTGRLHQALVETGKATSSFGGDGPAREAGSLYFGATVAKDAPLEPVRDTLLQTVEGFAAKPVTAEEVERARTKLKNDVERLLTDARSLAGWLSEFVALGDWRLLYLYQTQLDKVTREDVQRVAATYLRSTNRTLGLFYPEATPDRVVVPPAPDVAALVKDVTAAEVAAGETFDPTPENIEGRVLRKDLPSGMTVVLLPKKTRGGRVVAQIGLRWGSEASNAGRHAACSIASAMLSRGTRKHSRAELRDELERLQATINVSTGGATIQTTRANLPEALRLAAEMLREPTFPATEFEQVKRQVLSSIDSERADPQSLANLYMGRHLNPYPASHWLYHPTLDERATRYKAVTLEEARSCHHDLIGASDSELAVIGDFELPALERLATELFGDWKTPKPYQRISQRYFDVSPLTRQIETPDKANAVYRAGMNLKLRDDDPDFPALVLGNYLLGGSSDARLARRVREQEGLSYSVGSWLYASAQDEAAEFGLYAIHAPQNRARVHLAIMEEVRKALTDGFSAQEFEDGRKALLRARQVQRSADNALVARLASYAAIGRTFAWDIALEQRIATLTREEVRAALQRHLQVDKISLVQAGDFPRVARTPDAAKSN